MDEFKDVLDNEVFVERVHTQEFEFGQYSLVRVNNHWEIQFEDSQGAQSIIVQYEDFDENEEFKFMIDEEEEVFPKSSLMKIEKFCLENHLI